MATSRSRPDTARKTLQRSRSRQRSRSDAPPRERQILNAATEMFHERGYADSSVEDVANAVGILKGSLYYYIDTKEDLLFRILEDVHEGVQEIMDRVAERDDLGALERLELYVREQVAYNARHIKEIAVYYHDLGRLTGDRLADIRRRRRKSEEWVIGLIEEAQARGEVDPDLDTRLAASCIFAPIAWMYTWFRPGRGASANRLGDFVAEFILNGLTGARPAQPSPTRRRGRSRAGAT
jgi:TetR/AcrR family transcriptional regulator, cholesterol catabolism regulator